MKKRFISLLLLALGLSVFAQGSMGERLTVNMTAHEIAITSNFTGATITLFGAIQKIADPNLVPHPLTLVPIQPKQGPVEDIVVVIKGPPEDVTVRRKERVAGVWVNNNSMTFKDVPGFYFVASTQPLDLIADEELRARNEIGADHLALFIEPDELERFTDQEAADFRTALFRRKTASGLYGIDEHGVILQDRTLFNMRLKIPANVPVGEYVAQILLLRDGKVVGSQPLHPRVAKSGIERWIYYHSHSIPFVYGFIAVGLAALAGWTASLIFRQK